MIIQVEPIDYKLLAQRWSAFCFHTQFPAPDYRCFFKPDSKRSYASFKTYLETRGLEYTELDQLPNIKEE